MKLNPLNYCQKNTSKTVRCLKVNFWSEIRRGKYIIVTTLAFGRSYDVENTTMCQRCFNVIQRRDQTTTNNQRCYSNVCYLRGHRNWMLTKMKNLSEATDGTLNVLLLTS